MVAVQLVGQSTNKEEAQIPSYPSYPVFLLVWFPRESPLGTRKPCSNMILSICFSTSHTVSFYLSPTSLFSSNCPYNLVLHLSYNCPRNVVSPFLLYGFATLAVVFLCFAHFRRSPVSPYCCPSICLPHFFLLLSRAFLLKLVALSFVARTSIPSYCFVGFLFLYC